MDIKLIDPINDLRCHTHGKVIFSRPVPGSPRECVPCMTVFFDQYERAMNQLGKGIITQGEYDRRMPQIEAQFLTANPQPHHQF